MQKKIWFHKIEGAYKANAACTLICRPQTYICLKGSTGKSCVLSVFTCRLVIKKKGEQNENYSEGDVCLVNNNFDLKSCLDDFCCHRRGLKFLFNYQGTPLCVPVYIVYISNICQNLVMRPHFSCYHKLKLKAIWSYVAYSLK